MVTFVQPDGERISVPFSICDLTSFCEWAESDDFPESGRIWWLEGDVWVDVSMEQLFTHNLLKTKIAFGLTGLVEGENLGVFFGDGAFLSNLDADIAGEPDGLFVANSTLNSDRLRLVGGKDGGHVELQGSADMVLEVLSPSSRYKDEVALKQAYWEAGITEYWLVNALAQPLRFDLFRHAQRGYVAARRQDGWVKSAVFGKSFRIVEKTRAPGIPDYTLEIR